MSPWVRLSTDAQCVPKLFAISAFHAEALPPDDLTVREETGNNGQCWCGGGTSSSGSPVCLVLCTLPRAMLLVDVSPGICSAKSPEGSAPSSLAISTPGLVAPLWSPGFAGSVSSPIITSCWKRLERVCLQNGPGRAREGHHGPSTLCASKRRSISRRRAVQHLRVGFASHALRRASCRNLLLILTD